MIKYLYTLIFLLVSFCSQSQNVYLVANEPIFSEEDAITIRGLSGDYIPLLEVSLSLQNGDNERVHGAPSKEYLTIKIDFDDILYSYPKIITEKLQGTVFNEGEIIVTRNEGDTEIYQKYKFDDFVISNTEIVNGIENILVIDIFFDQFEQTNYSFSDTGVVTGTMRYGWDYKSMVEWSAPF